MEPILRATPRTGCLTGRVRVSVDYPVERDAVAGFCHHEHQEETRMTRILALLLLAAANPTSTDDAFVADLATAKFVDTTTPGAAKGSQNALLAVDPNTKGPTAYSRSPGGSGLPAHWHTYGEYTV